MRCHAMPCLLLFGGESLLPMMLTIWRTPAVPENHVGVFSSIERFPIHALVALPFGWLVIGRIIGDGVGS